MCSVRRDDHEKQQKLVLRTQVEITGGWCLLFPFSRSPVRHVLKRTEIIVFFLPFSLSIHSLIPVFITSRDILGLAYFDPRTWALHTNSMWFTWSAHPSMQCDLSRKASVSICLWRYNSCWSVIRLISWHEEFLGESVQINTYYWASAVCKHQVRPWEYQDI